MGSRTQEPNPNMSSVENDQFPPLPEPVIDDSKDVAGQVRFGQGTQPWWFKYWPYVLIAWALWFAFFGGQGLFHIENPINYGFSGVVIAWAIYHLLAPRFKWPGLPLG
jgi:hypothetical protein